MSGWFSQDLVPGSPDPVDADVTDLIGPVAPAADALESPPASKH